MTSRIPRFALLLSSLAIAGVDRGDTLLTQSPSLDLGSWVVDGTKVSTRYQCTLLIPGTCSYSLSASDSIALLPGSPGGDVFLRVLSANSLSPVPTKRQATFVPGQWWKVKGKTGSWAMEIDSTYFQSHFAKDGTPDTLVIHPHWARIQKGRRWVKWVDTVRNQILTRSDMGKIRATRSHLLRCLVDSSFAIDTIHGRVEARYPYSRGTDVHWSASLSLSLPDTAAPFLSSVLDSNGSKTANGSFHGVGWGSSASLSANTYVVWSTGLRPDLIVNPSTWENLPSPSWPYWMVVAGIWTFRISGVRDSVVSLGYVPFERAEGILPRAHGSIGTSLHAVDLQGRPVPLGRALPSGPRLVPVDGRLEPVVVRP